MSLVLSDAWVHECTIFNSIVSGLRKVKVKLKCARMGGNPVNPLLSPSPLSNTDVSSPSLNSALEKELL